MPTRGCSVCVFDQKRHSAKQYDEAVDPVQVIFPVSNIATFNDSLANEIMLTQVAKTSSSILRNYKLGDVRYMQTRCP
jgi:hypothetical protein